MRTYIYNKDTNVIIGKFDGHANFNGLNLAYGSILSEQNLSVGECIKPEMMPTETELAAAKARELSHLEPLAELVEILKIKGTIADEDISEKLAVSLAELRTAKATLSTVKLPIEDKPQIELPPQ